MASTAIFAMSATVIGKSTAAPVQSQFVFVVNIPTEIKITTTEMRAHILRQDFFTNEFFYVTELTSAYKFSCWRNYRISGHHIVFDSDISM
jgi:hypothetical protein